MLQLFICKKLTQFKKCKTIGGKMKLKFCNLIKCEILVSFTIKNIMGSYRIAMGM